ncbi:MAG: TetR/AcrR family transcriptional regulator [Candidatus Thiodiazotropha endolucinida]|nr:TetR/AcrR family transcriptional regulator [Candidatus Thiodiazotropha taylori]MCW4349699.1 TetR/AcrR family transcriptional regulator [Candidatus Thiodiazotropha endolucinida]
MARRSDHSREEIRDMALEAAEQIILEEGHDGLTARKVASEIGYTVGTIYLVFENLDDLVMHINARTLDRLHQLMTDGDVQSLAPKDRLLRLGQVYIHFAYGDPHRWALIFEHRPADDRTMPDWYREKVMHVFAVVEEALRPLAPRRSKRDISQAACALWAGVHGICILGITQKLGTTGENSVLKLAKSLILNYLGGFTGKGVSEK